MAGNTRLMDGAGASLFAGSGSNARANNYDRFGQPQAIMAAMYPVMYQDSAFHREDFLGLDLDPYIWDSEATYGINPWSVDSGVCYAGTGSTSGNTVSLWSAQNLLPSKNAGMEIRFKVDTVTNFHLETGLRALTTDPLTSLISDIDTPAAQAQDTGAVFTIDTSQTLTMGAVALSSALGVTVTSAAVGTFTPSAANFYTVRVQSVFDGSAGYTVVFHIFDTNAARMTIVTSGKQSLSTATDATTALRPWFMIRTRNTTEKVATISYVAKWMDR